MRTALWLAAGALLWTGFAPAVSAQEVKPPQQPPQAQPAPPPDGSGSSGAPPSASGRTPSQTLNRSGGVLKPPSSGSSNMPVIHPPASGGNMPVIHPPGTPGGNSDVQPK